MVVVMTPSLYEIHSLLSSGHCDEDLTLFCAMLHQNHFGYTIINSPILILRTHNPVTTKGDHQSGTTYKDYF